MSSGIRDKVAILGMGCSRFGERWDMGAEELMVESFTEALTDAGIGREQDAALFERLADGRAHQGLGDLGVGTLQEVLAGIDETVEVAHFRSPERGNRVGGGPAGGG